MQEFQSPEHEEAVADLRNGMPTMGQVFELLQSEHVLKGGGLPPRRPNARRTYVMSQSILGVVSDIAERHGLSNSEVVELFLSVGLGEYFQSYGDIQRDLFGDA